MSTLALTGFALPLAFDPSAALPFPVMKSVVLGVLAYALAALTALRCATMGFAAIPRTWLHAAVALLLGVLVVASLTAVDSSIAMWGAYDRRLGFAAYLEFAVIFFAASAFLRTDRDRSVVFAGVVLGGVVVLAYAIAQRLRLDPIHWSGGGEFAFSTLGNSNILGHYFSVLAAASLAATVSRVGTLSWRWNLAHAVLAAAFAFGAVLSGARAAFLGLGVGITAGIGLRAWQLRGRAHPAVLTAAALVAIAIIAVAATFTPAGARLALLLTGTDSSLSERSLLYQTIGEIVSERPLLGVGPDNLASTYNAHRPVGALQFGLVQTQSSAHGWPWRIALDGGLLALGAFACVLITLAFYTIRWIRSTGGWQASAVLTALTTYLAAGVFSIGDVGTEWLLWLCAGIVGGSVASTVPPPVRHLTWHKALMALLALGILWPLVGAGRDIGASRALRASQIATGRDRAGALLSARRAVEYDDRWPAHWNNLGLRSLEVGDRSLALTAFERAVARGWFDPLIWKNLGTVQAQLANAQPSLTGEAKRSAERAIDADPNNPEAHIGAAQIYLLLGDDELAAKQADAALALTPKNGAALEMATVAYLRVSRLDDALAAITTALGLNETPEWRLLLARVQIARQQPGAAREALRRVLEIEPGNRDAAALLQQLGP